MSDNNLLSDKTFTFKYRDLNKRVDEVIFLCKLKLFYVHVSYFG